MVSQPSPQPLDRVTQGGEAVLDPAQQAGEETHVGGEEQGREGDEEPALQDGQHEAGDPDDQQTPPEYVTNHSENSPFHHQTASPTSLLEQRDELLEAHTATSLLRAHQGRIRNCEELPRALQTVAHAAYPN